MLGEDSNVESEPFQDSDHKDNSDVDAERHESSSTQVVSLADSSLRSPSPSKIEELVPSTDKDEINLFVRSFFEIFLK